MCFHGFGHGVLAFSDYELPKALELCEKVGTEKYDYQEAKECVGGALMEMRGGMHNPVLMQSISSQLPGVVIKTTNELDINPDAKEAVLFALLANECICGDILTFGKGSGGIPAVSMGKISLPT